MVECRPLYDVLAVRALHQKRSEGGLEIPDKAKDPLPLVRIVAAGEGRLLPDGTVQPLRVKVGDLAVLVTPPQAAICVEGEMLGLTPEQNVAGVVTGVDLSLFDEGTTVEEFRENMAKAQVEADSRVVRPTVRPNVVFPRQRRS